MTVDEANLLKFQAEEIGWQAEIGRIKVYGSTQIYDRTDAIEFTNEGWKRRHESTFLPPAMSDAKFFGTITLPTTRIPQSLPEEKNMWTWWDNYLDPEFRIQGKPKEWQSCYIRIHGRSTLMVGLTL
jgi:hypothetical protein